MDAKSRFLQLIASMKRRPKIAVLCPISLNDHAGNVTRIKRLVSNLSKVAEVHLISLGKDCTRPSGLDCQAFYYVRSKRFPEYISPLGLVRRKVRTQLCNRWGVRKGIDFWFDESWRPQLRQLSELHNYDIVIAEYVFCTNGLASFPKALKVVDCHDIFFRRRAFEDTLNSQWFHCNSSTAEARGWNRADIVLGIQENESGIIRNLVPTKEVLTLGHPLHFETIYDPTINDRIAIVASETVSNVTGILQYINGPFKKIVELSPRAQLIIAGSACRQIPDSLNVQKLGIVQCLKDFYTQISFAINPVSNGTGLKIKTVEAIEYGCPILSSDVGLDGLECLKCQGVVECRSCDDWVEESIKLLSSQSLRRDASNQLRVAAERYNECLLGVIDRLIAKRGVASN